jgi:hypothetical protein
MNMSTQVFSAKTNECVAVRFSGGTARGPMVQMEVTEFEFDDWKNVEVFEETNPDDVMFFGDWVEKMKAEGRTFVWDNAPRQNAMARDFENHRWPEMMKPMAESCRQRARECVKQMMRGNH